MLDAFEARLADVFADRLAGVPDLRPPARSRPGVPPAAGTQPVLRIVAAATSPLLGDDVPQLRRAADGLRLRTELELAGMAVIDLVPAPSLGRAAQLQAADAVLVAFQAQDVRGGAAFDDGTDRGFRLRGFRLRELGPPPPAETLPAETLRLQFTFEGTFWPVRPEEAGPAIAAVPQRLVTLPVGAAAGLTARAGGPDLVIPVRLDLRQTGSWPGGVIARLRGAAPPGSLPGDPAGAPGFTAVAVDAAGVAQLVFRPAATVAAATRAEIQLALEGAGAPRGILAELAVQVVP